MLRSRLHRLLGALSAATLLVTAVGHDVSAAASPDDKAPLLWIVKSPAFLDNTTVNGIGFSSDPVLYYTSMTVEVQWGAKDPSGICGYSLYEMPTGAPPVALFENQMLTSYRVSANEYDGSFGGGSTLTAGWKVVATDCAGNSSTSKLIPNLPTSVQDDGTSPGAAPGAISYDGAWSLDECVCWSAGSTHTTSVEGASVSYTAQFVKGEHIAVVMPVGPDRGRVRIFVDGNPISRVDTYADAPGYRRVVWEAWMSEGEHTITVANLATPDRERVDIDAFLHSKRIQPAT